MKILVTGGAGYIGSVATARLVDRGEDVVVVDNLARGHGAAVADRARLVQLDLDDARGLNTVFQEFQPDAVLHFAALTIAPESVAEPDRYWRTNVTGTLHLLDAVRRSSTRFFVLSSTAAVYGVPSESPIPETAPLNPVNPYGSSKLAAEMAVASYASAFGFAFAALRYFNVAGAEGSLGEDHHPETHLIPIAIETALGYRDELVIYGNDFPTPDGTAIRDYVHVSDLVDAHLLALDRLSTTGESLGAINLGTRHGASVREVVAAVEQVTGVTLPARLGDRRPGDPPSLVADSSRARQELGWQPHRSTLPEMISSTWEWRRRHPTGYAESN